jgi:hypothetical protein
MTVVADPDVRRNYVVVRERDVLVGAYEGHFITSVLRLALLLYQQHVNVRDLHNMVHPLALPQMYVIEAFGNRNIGRIQVRDVEGFVSRAGGAGGPPGLLGEGI